MAPDLLERLNTYHDEVQGQVDAIAEERRGAARYDRWYGRMRRGSPATVAGVTVGFMLVPFLLGGFLWGLVSLLGEQTVGRWMPYLPAPLFGMVFLVLPPGRRGCTRDRGGDGPSWASNRLLWPARVAGRSARSSPACRPRRASSAVRPCFRRNP